MKDPKLKRPKKEVDDDRLERKREWVLERRDKLN